MKPIWNSEEATVGARAAVSEVELVASVRIIGRTDV